eukprot:2469042-Rhodomonas_salina.2
MRENHRVTWLNRPKTGSLLVKSNPKPRIASTRSHFAQVTRSTDPRSGGHGEIKHNCSQCQYNLYGSKQKKALDFAESRTWPTPGPAVTVTVTPA